MGILAYVKFRENFIPIFDIEPEILNFANQTLIREIQYLRFYIEYWNEIFTNFNISKYAHSDGCFRFAKKNSIYQICKLKITVCSPSYCYPLKVRCKNGLGLTIQILCDAP